MINDFGTLKSVLATPAQTGPTAPADVRKPDPLGNSTEAKGGQAAESANAEQPRSRQAEPVEDVVSDLNELVRNLHRELQFSVDRDSGDTVIKVVDKETDEVVRQIPSEELMDLRQRLQDAAGAIFEDSA
jgi:flagellar protein FlaG